MGGFVFLIKMQEVGVSCYGLRLGNREDSKQKVWENTILNKTRFSYSSSPISDQLLEIRT